MALSKSLLWGISTTTPAGIKSDYNNSQNMSFSIGAYDGLKLGPILMGAEGGYEYFVASSLSGPSGSLNYKIDLSGFYLLIFTGLVF